MGWQKIGFCFFSNPKLCTFQSFPAINTNICVLNLNCCFHLGYFCDKEITICNTEANTCHPINTEQCIDVFPLDYTCECKSGWSGQRCDVEIDECSSDPCLNEAQCVDQIDG